MTDKQELVSLALQMQKCVNLIYEMVDGENESGYAYHSLRAELTAKMHEVRRDSIKVTKILYPMMKYRGKIYQ